MDRRLAPHPWGLEVFYAAAVAKSSDTMLGLLLLLLLDPSAVAGVALTLPPLVYGTEGWEGNIYFDNLSRATHRTPPHPAAGPRPPH